MELKHILFVPPVHIHFYKHTSLEDVKFVIDDFYGVTVDAYAGIWVPGHFLRIPAMLCTKNSEDIKSILEENVRSFVQVFDSGERVGFQVSWVKLEALDWLYNPQTDTEEPYGSYFVVELAENKRKDEDTIL